MTPQPAYKTARPGVVSTHSHAALDIGSRLPKLTKISTILESFCDLGQARLLDIGVGNGVITSGLAVRCREAAGVDVVDERLYKEGYDFHLVRDERLPFTDGCFDVVVSNHVIQFMHDQVTHLKEIERVLRPGGICYLAFSNKFSMMQPHR